MNAYPRAPADDAVRPGTQNVLTAQAVLPGWPAPPNVRALCTTRAGGVSLAPWDSLNLGDHVGDSVSAVAANRARLAQAIAARPVFLKQVHACGLVELDANTPDGATGDACLTRAPGLACTIMVADCLPVLLCDRQGSTVGAAHAGWRGLAGVTAARGGGPRGVLEETCGRFFSAARIEPADIAARTLAWLGPCIGPNAFEVGDEVKAAFEAHGRAAAAMFKSQAQGKWLADLPGLARQRLRALGISAIHGNDGTLPWCTVSNPSQFFSHRRDGRSGRFAACIWLL